MKRMKKKEEEEKINKCTSPESAPEYQWTKQKNGAIFYTSFPRS